MGLCCCARTFSSCSERGLLFVAVHGLLTAVDSLVVEHGLQAHGLSRCDSRAPECRLSSCGTWASLLCSMWDLPGLGLEPMSSALAGRFLTTVAPGKPRCRCFPCQLDPSWVAYSAWSFPLRTQGDLNGERPRNQTPKMTQSLLHVLTGDGQFQSPLRWEVVGKNLLAMLIQAIFLLFTLLLQHHNCLLPQSVGTTEGGRGWDLALGPLMSLSSDLS